MTHPVMCPACRTPMDPALAEAGITTHPDCVRPVPFTVPHTLPTCGRCGARVQWALTPAGKPVALDPPGDGLGDVACRVEDGVRHARLLRSRDAPWEGEARRTRHACQEGKR